MGRNVEIKARATDFAQQQERAAELADSPPELLSQEDTFFRSKRGRLKLRRFDADRGELIYYERPDARGPSESRYMILPTREAVSLRDALSKAFQVWSGNDARSIMWRAHGFTWTRSRVSGSS